MSKLAHSHQPSMDAIEAQERRPSYVIRNQYGAFCAACQSHLTEEEDAFDVCDTCGGEGMGGDDED